jgi:SAM-dependent methyltransferase
MMNNAVKWDTTIINKIIKHVSKHPFEYYPICELTNPNKWYSSEWAKLQEGLTYYHLDFIHMKSWKRLQYIYGLKKLEVQNDNSIGLGMDVGHEPLIYFFCSKVKHIVTTDICDEKSIGMAAAKEGDPEILSDVDKFAPFPYKKERLEIKRMKGRKLEFPENTFVFIWSCSSIEHFGGHEEAAKSIKEMERVLKHSGFLALATEFVIHQDIITGFKSEHPYFFNLEALYKYLIASHNLKSVQNINFSLSAYYIKIYIKLPEESQSPHMNMHRKPHIVLCQGNVLFTSIFLFFRKEV